jgi:hypothetical protein
MLAFPLNQERRRMHIRLIGLLCGFSFALMRIASAQDIENPPFFSNKDAEAAIAYAMSALPQVKCGKEACPAATPEELASPPVEPEDARLALITGARSARLKWCGLEWEKRTFLMMMRSLQHKGIQDARKLTILQIIHSAQFSKDYSGLQALKTCTDKIRADLDAQFPQIELPPWQRSVDHMLLDQSVAGMLQRVLGDIEKSRCGPDPCAPATDEEKANPPLTLEDARRAMKVGLLAGTAEFCGLDWQSRIFLPFLAFQHRTLKMSARQIAIVSMLHGTMQGFMLDGHKKLGTPCTDQMRQTLEKQLSSG